MGGTNLGEWKQSPPPKTYKEKYEKLRELIYANHQMYKDSEIYRRARETLENLITCIEYLERKK